jgi:hypothetical protein
MHFSATVGLMSFFAVELTDLISRHFDGNQQRFSTATGIDPSMVSRQCSGRALPDRVTLQKILAGVPSGDSALLAAAYLRDVCPPAVRDSVHIYAVDQPDGKQRKETPQHLLDLSSLATREQVLATEIINWLMTDSAAYQFLYQALRLVTRSTSVPEFPRDHPNRKTIRND